MQVTFVGSGKREREWGRTTGVLMKSEWALEPSGIMALAGGSFSTSSCRLCLSITDFHPDTWNPAWSVSTILTGLLSFMVEKGPTLGSIETSEFTVSLPTNLQPWEVSSVGLVSSDCQLLSRIWGKISFLLKSWQWRD